MSYDCVLLLMQNYMKKVGERQMQYQVRNAADILLTSR